MNFFIVQLMLLYFVASDLGGKKGKEEGKEGKGETGWAVVLEIVGRDQ